MLPPKIVFVVLKFVPSSLTEILTVGAVVSKKKLIPVVLSVFGFEPSIRYGLSNCEVDFVQNSPPTSSIT